MLYLKQRELLDGFDLSLKTRELTVLVLSDLHFKIGEEESTKDKKWRNGNEKAMIAFFTKWKKKEKVDIIIVAGDLSSQGNEEGYKTFMAFLTNLKKLPCFSHAICFTCPGNHDIDRKSKSGSINKNFKQALIPLLHDPISGEFFDSFTKEALVDLIFTRIKNIPKNKHKNFLESLSEFEKVLFKTYLDQTSNYLGGCMNEKFREKINSLKNIKTVYMAKVMGIDLLSVNSAWFCGLFNRDKEKLFLLKPAIDALLAHKNKISGNRKHRSVTLTLMHHPHSWLHENEYNSTNGNEQTFSKLAKDTDIFISGHEHGDFKKPHAFNNEAHIIINGCSFNADLTPDRKCWPSTFGILKVKKIANDFSLNRYRIKEATTAEEWKWVPDGSDGERIKYLRPKSKWNFEIDSELIYQQAECIRFIKAHILAGVPGVDQIPMLLSRQLNNFHRIEAKISEFFDHNSYYGKDKQGNWVLIMPISVIMDSLFDPMKLRDKITGIKQSDKVTCFAFIDESCYPKLPDLLARHEKFKGWLKEKNNYYSQSLPILFSNKIFIV